MATPGEELRDGVAEIATEIGETLTFHNATLATYDNDSGAATITESDVDVVVTHFGHYKLSEVDGTNIVYGDAKTIMPAKDATFTPQNEMLLTRGADGTVWKVKDVLPIQMSGTTAGWPLVLSKQ